MPRLKLLLSFLILGLSAFLLFPKESLAVAAGQLDIYCAGSNSINTALGCLSFDLAGGGLVQSILTLATGIGGAIALLLMLYGFFILSTSAGIPDKIKEGQEIITSAVGGLLFIIFSVVLMNLIGIKILNLPGLQ